MHLLIIPSEEYVPSYAPLAGIFQKHQISVLKKSSYRIGVLSIRLKYSILMIARAIVYRSLAIKVDNELDELALVELMRLAINKLFNLREYISLESQEEVEIVRVEGVYYFSPSSTTDHISWVRAGLLAYETYVKEYGRPDIMHAHNALYGGLLALNIEKKYGVPYVLTEHSSYYYQGLVPSKLYGKVCDAIAHAECFTVVSPRLKEVLVNTLGSAASKAICLPNVLPPEFENQTLLAKRECRSQGESFIFLCVGNLLPVKGHEYVIRAFTKICKTHDNVVLKIVGSGPERAKLEALVLNNNLSNNVVFTGEVSSKSVRVLMLEANVFVFPSLFETFGVALIEAMACGLPVISTACGGPESIVTKDTGILVEVGNVESMTEALSWMYNNEEKLEPTVIRKIVVEKFGSSAFLHKISKIYHSETKNTGRVS